MWRYLLTLGTLLVALLVARPASAATGEPVHLGNIATIRIGDGAPCYAAPAAKRNAEACRDLPAEKPEFAGSKGTTLLGRLEGDAYYIVLVQELAGSPSELLDQVRKGVMAGAKTLTLDVGPVEQLAEKPVKHQHLAATDDDFEVDIYVVGVGGRAAAVTFMVSEKNPGYAAAVRRDIDTLTISSTPESSDESARVGRAIGQGLGGAFRLGSGPFLILVILGIWFFTRSPRLAPGQYVWTNVPGHGWYAVRVLAHVGTTCTIQFEDGRAAEVHRSTLRIGPRRPS